MLNDMNKSSLFCDYYRQWVDVYKKGAILDAVDEGLIQRDPTRKAIIKGKTPKAKKIKYLNQFELHILIAHLNIKEEPNWDLLVRIKSIILR